MQGYPDTRDFLANIEKYVYNSRQMSSRQVPIRKVRLTVAQLPARRRRKHQEPAAAAASQPQADLPLSTHAIFREFQRYGDIVDIWRNYNFAIILYATLGDGVSLLRPQNVTLDSVTYTMEAIKEEDQRRFIMPNRVDQCPVGETLRTAASQDSAKHIVNLLNDDTLMAIFERAHLLDLCAIANVCRRFNAVAKRVFSARYTGGVCPIGDLCHVGEVTLSQVDRCVRTFADCRVIFKDVNKKCRNIDIYLGVLNEHDATVDELELAGESVRTDTLTAIRPMLMRLRRLSLTAAHTHAARIDADAAWHLHRLTIDWQKGDKMPAIVALPGLVELDLNRFNGSGEVWLDNVLRASPNVRVLRLNEARLSVRQLQVMAGYLRGLLELHTDRVAWHGFDDGQLEHRPDMFASLRRLVVRSARTAASIPPMLSHMVLRSARIEDLTLHWHEWRQSSVVGMICEMPSIVTLAIRGSFDGAGKANAAILRIVREMQQLRDLTVDSTEIGFEHVRGLLPEAGQLTVLHVRLTMLKFDGDVEVLDAISALIAASPGRRVTVRAHIVEIDVSVATAMLAVAS